MTPVILAIIATGSTVISYISTVNSDADIVLEAVKPFNNAICTVEKAKTHNAETTAAINAFCANLPDNIPGLITQAAAVFEAVKKEEDAK